jgi:hypothetical protein
VNISYDILLVKNIFIFCAQAGGKHAPGGKCLPYPKSTAIDLEINIRMIHEYEGGRSLSAIASELPFVQP